MNALLVVVLLLVLSCSVSTGSLRTRELRNLAHIEEELRMLHKSEEAIIGHYIDDLQLKSNGVKSRGPRASESHNHKAMCGAKLLNYVKTICSLTVSNTEIDIATKCCNQGCDDTYIKKAMCPNE